MLPHTSLERRGKKVCSTHALDIPLTCRRSSNGRVRVPVQEGDALHVVVRACPAASGTDGEKGEIREWRETD